MTDQFITYGYHITTDAKFQNIKFGITPELEKQLESLGTEAQNKKNKKIIDKLTQLILKYPKSPQLKNFLSVAFNVQGKHQKAIEVNNWILTEHPDYLFAKINKANNHILKGEFDQVLKTLGDALEIKSLYPDRDLFHITEVSSFLIIAIHYFIAIDNIELAENRFDILKKLAPNHPHTEEAEKMLFNYSMKEGLKRFEEVSKNKITPKTNKIVPLSKKREAPNFNHHEIHDLYNFGFRIPHEKINQILMLPRKTLIEDLEMILIDAVERFDNFNAKKWDKAKNNFVLHAIFILKEIQATESLPKIFLFLEHDEDFLDYWIGDHLTETLWQCFYTLGFNQTVLLKQFLLKPGIDTYVKTAVSDTLEQINYFHPEKREEILSLYLEVFTYFSEAKISDNLIDSDFLGLSVSNVIDSKMIELLPIIKVLYDKRYITIDMNGTYEDVVKDFKNEPYRNPNKKPLTIFEIYEFVLNNWDGYNEEKEVYKPTDTYQQLVSNKIGRNELCTCGSGKKYKKCCIEKK